MTLWRELLESHKNNGNYLVIKSPRRKICLDRYTRLDVYYDKLEDAIFLSTGGESNVVLTDFSDYDRREISEGIFRSSLFDFTFDRGWL